MNISKAAVGGLLWLSFSAFAFGDTLTITGQPNPVEDGGQFTATLGSDPSQELFVYCVDYRNFVSVPNPAYDVNVTDLANSTDVFDNTRYGQTATADFTNQTVPAGIGTPDAQLSAAEEPNEAAARLFATLRALDRPPFTGIAVMPIPEAGLGAAINDRLRRAAAPRG